MEHRNLTIVELRAENVKRIKAATVRPDGSVVIISGKNGAGKSSLMDAIFMALAGAEVIPGKPVRDGADEARITLDLGTLIIRRRIKPDRSTVVTVEAADGAQYKSPQTMLERLMGAIGFDPFAFTKLPKAAQRDVLRAMVPIGVDIDTLDALNEADYRARTEANRNAKTYQAQADAIVLGEEPTEIDTAAIRAAFAEAEEANEARNAAIVEGQSLGAAIERNKESARQATADAKRHDDEIADLLERIEELKAWSEAAKQRAANAAAEAVAQSQTLEGMRAMLPAKVDTSDILARLSAAEEANRKRQQHIALAAEKRRRLELAAEATAESERLTAAMAEREKTKADALAAAPFPVAGLGFDGEGVTLNGIPFDQASTAEQIRVSLALGIASNPAIKVMRIRDGSLLDDDSMAAIADQAEAAGFQVWIERVAHGEPVGIVIEDGTVAGAQ